MEIILDIFFFVAIVISFFSNIYGAPGNILIAINTLLYGLLTGFERFSFGYILTIFLVVLIVEVLEYFLIAFAARRYGASRWGVTGGIIGGIIGAISGAFVTPILGAIIGSIIGVFIGASLLEYVRSFDLKMAINSGIGAFIGKIGAFTVKMCGAVTLVVMIAYRLF